MKKVYTVFVGGAEVNDFYLTLKQAKEYHADYIADGYDPYIHKTIFNSDGSVKEYVHVPMATDRVYA